jgi:hypothetical protein
MPNQHEPTSKPDYRTNSSAPGEAVHLAEAIKCLAQVHQHLKTEDQS